MIEVAARFILRSCNNKQNANRSGDDRNIEHCSIWETPAGTYRLCALKQVAATVVKQFPRQPEQERSSFSGGLEICISRARFKRRIHVNRKATAGVIADASPGVNNVCC